jgi:hypothetical protein
MSGKINIDNYEAFVLDHMEGNLSAELTAELKAFLMIHPELDVDLEDTQLVSLEIDTLLFNEKESLKKINAPLNDEQFVAYIENELSGEEKIKFEKAVAADKFLQKELAVYKHTILKADSSIVFTDKASLKRKPKVLWFRSAANLSMAAALVLILGLWFMFRGSFGTSAKTNTNELANLKPIPSKTNSVKEETAPTTQTVEITNEEPRLNDAVGQAKHLASNKTRANTTPKKKMERTVITNTTSSVSNSTVPEVANNHTPSKQGNIIVIEPKNNEQPVFAANSKPNFIVTSGNDEEELVNPEPAKRQGLLARAGKALRGLNKLGVKQVNAVEDVKKDEEQYVLSLGNFSIKQNKYSRN